MSYHDQLDLELNRIAVLGGGRITADHPHGRLIAAVSEADNIGIAFESFVFTTDLLAGAETSRLTKIADRLSQKLAYLLEPIRVVEIDGLAGAVQLRSNPPYKRDQQTTYYEVLVERGGSISLTRFEKESGQPRVAITAKLTKEVFYRLADDFAEAV